MAALDPVLAGTIYKALGTASIGSAAVTAAQALQVQATPFGVRMPPRPVFNSQGQQVGTEEWPIGDVQVLSAQMTWTRWPAAKSGAGVRSGTERRRPSGAPAGQPLGSRVTLGSLGNLTVADEAPASALPSLQTRQAIRRCAL